MHGLLRKVPYSLEHHPYRNKIENILQAALTAADPKEAVEQILRCSDDTLRVGEQEYDLASFENIYLVAVGKASLAMAQGVCEILGNHLAKGLIVSKTLPSDISFALLCMEIIQAEHPIPGINSLEAGKRVLDLLSLATADDLVILAISGGGSALITQPEGKVQLGDIQILTNQLLASGASINEINTLRKHLDRVKGGGLARAVVPAQVVSLILSDVVGSPLDVIASGPTVPDASTFQQAEDIVEKYGLKTEAPESIRNHLESGSASASAETPKPGDPIFQKVQNILIASNEQSLRAAERQAIQEGMAARILTTQLTGEAKQAGKWLARVAQEMASDQNEANLPMCLVAGGETTVKLHGTGTGGRNQEVALAAAGSLKGLEGVTLITLASDGEDGPTSAAGAIVTGDTEERGLQMGMNIRDYLDRNDSFAYFKALDDLVITGSTGTNVNDLVFLFIDPFRN